jgi:hypothetical protein
MTQALQQLLDSFDRLPVSEQQEALSEIRKRVRDVDWSNVGRLASTPLSEEDEELVRIAEMTFLELDAREAADGKS